ncbi:MAG: DUF2877 domain-containing protein [Anaerolineales bacterium]|nr:DUF2877 domain-containing protein [Anaerolineales bacterium]
MGYNFHMNQVVIFQLTPRVLHWLQRPLAVARLQLFDRVMNLTDTEGEIISIVQTSVGAGPFSMVVDWQRPFPEFVSPQASVHKTSMTLFIGPLHLEWPAAELWQPTPPWDQLRQQPAQWRNRLPELQTAVAQHQDQLAAGSPTHFVSQFEMATAAIHTALAQKDMAGMQTAVAKLAGFGPGFTPAGDDFLVGFLFGLWATHPKEKVVKLAEIVVETAVPRTTQLSAAWLKAAGRGEAVEPWHQLLKALSNHSDWRPPLQTIMQTGATSGAAALLGFITTAQNRPSR